ncbi:hypothetical protein NQ318_001975 [Aromia moschata]|uniref:P-type domain-containing protein n=1 Tax=Aromia moschata TaxID=1265417 RepID=A0AAV8Z491_9CUCU|nr:hypothetical protein NQ318_001975 [Aromia moschata]
MATNASWLQEQNREREDYKNEGKYQRRITFKGIICNKIVKGWIFLTIFATVVPVLVYYFVVDQGTYKTNNSSTCSIKSEFRVPCGKINISSADCEKIHCCFELSTETCYHYLPSKYSYDFDENTNGYVAVQKSTPYDSASIQKLNISINEINENKVSIILHEDTVDVSTNTLNSAKNYKVKIADEKLIVEVYRSEDDDLLLSTAKGPLIASNNYSEWSFYLTNQTLLGLNQTLITVDENSTFNAVIYKNNYDHYTLPVFWAYKNKQFHGIVIKHDGPMEITILPSYMVILKSLTGGKIEVELSVGPTPTLLHDQQLVAQNIPSYWTMDTYMCRRGDNVNLTQLIKEYSLDLQATSDCIHENLLAAMMKDNGTNLQGVRGILGQLKEQGIKFLLSVPPQIFGNTTDLYKEAVSLDVLYKYNSTIYKGKYLKQDVVYPDYGHSKIQSYLKAFSTFLVTYIDIEDIDGFVLNANWPANDNYRISNLSFPYFTEDLREAMSNTLPWNSTLNNGSVLHLQKHNTYGYDQLTSMKTYFNSTNPNIFVTSASDTFGDGRPTIIQNVNASWSNLYSHIDNVLFNSIVGNHLVNTPVCGDTAVYDSVIQETLCIRWYLVAATMPAFRIGSTEPWRDPENLNTAFATQTVQRAIQRRKMFLPYYYTLLSRNEPALRPMFYDYYENTTTFSMKHQYMIGENILIAHPLSSGRTKLQVYLPSRIGVWYELWGGKMYNSTGEAWIDIDVVETDFVAFVSQGSVLPLRTDNIFNFIVALNCTSKICEASGTLFEESYLNFNATDTAITISGIPQNCNFTLENVTLYHYTNVSIVTYYTNKNASLCSGEDNITIDYTTESEDGIFI